MSDKPYRNLYQILNRGLGGIGAQFLERGNDVSVTIYDRRLRPYYGDVVEEGYIIDKIPALYENPDAVKIVMNCPLLDLKLENGQIDKCPQPSEMLLCGLQGSFQALAAMKVANPAYSGLDSVDLETYVDIWRNHGARIGQRKGSTVVWEDGQVEEIPSESNRWLG